MNSVEFHEKKKAWFDHILSKDESSDEHAILSDETFKHCKESQSAYASAIQALQEQQEREKGCDLCKPCCHNCSHDVYDGFCIYYGTHGCEGKHFQEKNNFCPNCGRDLRKPVEK